MKKIKLVKIETVTEFIGRGGEIRRVPLGVAQGVVPSGRMSLATGPRDVWGRKLPINMDGQ